MSDTFGAGGPGAPRSARPGLVLDGRTIRFGARWLPLGAVEVGRAAAADRSARTFVAPAPAGECWITVGVVLRGSAATPGTLGGLLHTVSWPWRDGATGAVTVAGPDAAAVARAVADSFTLVRPLPVGLPFDVPGCTVRTMDGYRRPDGTMGWTAAASVGPVDLVMTSGVEPLRAASTEVLSVRGRPAWYGPAEGAGLAAGVDPRLLAVDVGGGVQLSLVVLQLRGGPDRGALIRLAESVEITTPDLSWIGAPPGGPPAASRSGRPSGAAPAAAPGG
jgi:hypothetical protein